MHVLEDADVVVDHGQLVAKIQAERVVSAEVADVVAEGGNVCGDLHPARLAAGAPPDLQPVRGVADHRGVGLVVEGVGVVLVAPVQLHGEATHAVLGAPEDADLRHQDQLSHQRQRPDADAVVQPQHVEVPRQVASGGPDLVREVQHAHEAHAREDLRGPVRGPLHLGGASRALALCLGAASRWLHGVAVVLEADVARLHPGRGGGVGLDVGGLLRLLLLRGSVERRELPADEVLEALVDPALILPAGEQVLLLHLGQLVRVADFLQHPLQALLHVGQLQVKLAAALVRGGLLDSQEAEAGGDVLVGLLETREQLLLVRVLEGALPREGPLELVARDRPREVLALRVAFAHPGQSRRAERGVRRVDEGLRRVRRVPPPEVHAASAGAPALLHRHEGSAGGQAQLLHERFAAGVDLCVGGELQLRPVDGVRAPESGIGDRETGHDVGGLRGRASLGTC
mmetsp:Transcript_48182/g.142193  ORF Transcript_48182/g.142193 Transcript_48182/m.142193 type:complete len:457 (-) Transcript_48182:87-1457(-)